MRWMPVYVDSELPIDVRNGRYLQGRKNPSKLSRWCVKKRLKDTRKLGSKQEKKKKLVLKGNQVECGMRFAVCGLWSAVCFTRY